MKQLFLCSLMLAYCGPPTNDKDGGQDAALDTTEEQATFPDVSVPDVSVPDVNTPETSDASVDVVADVVKDVSNDVSDDVVDEMSPPINNGINYNGGPVMLGTTNIYLIWYGNWTGNTTTAIIPDLISGLSGSSYQNITTSYYMLNGGAKQYISNSLALAGTYNDNYSQGTNLGANAINVVNNAVAVHFLTWDPNGIYFVLASSDVSEGQSCNQYCGYHSYGMTGSTAVKWAFILNPAACPSSCSYAQTEPTPNGNLGADAMASIFAHELGETLTDPLISAWYNVVADVGTVEMGDLCAWNFGSTFTTSNGSVANVSFGTPTRSFLLQTLWVNADGGYCGLHYP